MDEFDKALEYLDAPSTPTATPSATTETSSATAGTPSISEVNNHNVDVMIGALKDLNVDVSKGEEGVLKGTMKGWKRASAIPGMTARATTSAPTISTSRSTEANKKDEARKAASNRKREARRAALAAYEKERFKEQPNKQPEVKKKRLFFSSRRKSAPAGSLNAPVSPLSVPASSSELDLKKIDELEWRSFNTWVLDLASGLRDCSSSFNRIVPEESKEFKVEPLKNDETYNPYNPVYVIHYFKDFWDKIKGFYEAEKVKLEGSNEVDEFIKTIDKENWVDDGWDNPKFSTNPKAKEPELNKNNEVIKAFDGWLEIIKKNIINLQDKLGKKNIEKIRESEKKWKKYNELVKKYNIFVAKQSKIVNSKISKKVLERINKNDRKAQEIATRIVYPIFVDEKFEGSKGSKGSKSAEVLEKFLTEQAQKCEAGKASTKYEKLKAILSDAKMIEGAGTLCTRLRNFYNDLISSNRNLVATLLSGHANNIRKFSVNSEQLEGLEKEFNELLDGVERNIEDLGKVYDNVEKAYKDDKSIIGEDHDFIFGKDENNCWRVYQNEDGTEKEIGYIAEVYGEVVKKDEKQEKNVFLKDPNGGVIPYKNARTYGSVSSYLCGSMGYLSFENNFTPNGEIKCYYTDEEGKENSVTFNANGMAIKINRQGKEMEVNKNSNAFKQLKQAFEGNQSSSIPPQGNLDINNNEKNEGGINMAETETTKIEAAKRQLMDFVAEYNYFLSLRGRFAEKHMELKDDFNKGILKDYRVDWWDKFEKYELEDLSDIDFVKAQWGMVLADLIRKYLPTGELDTATEKIYNIGTEFNSAKSNEEKLNILGKFHTEAKELLKKVEDKLIDLNNFSERIKNRGSAFEGPKDKKSGSANSGANTRYVSKEEEDKFVAEKLKGLSEYKKQCEAFRIRHSEFLKKAEYAEIIDDKMDETKFNKETWKNEPAEIKWLLGHDENRLYNLPFKYRSMAKLLINYFKEGSSEYTKYKNIIDESNSEDYGEKTIRQKIDFTSKAIESLGEMLWYLNGELYRLEGTEANGGEKTDEDVGETNVNEDAEQKEEPKTTETVDDPKLEEGAKPAEASGAATRENGLPPIPQRGLPLTPPEQAAANGGEKTNENVSKTNVNEDAEQKEEPKTTETVDDPKLEEGAKPLTVEEMNAKRESAVKDNQFKKKLPSAPVLVDKNGMPMDGLPLTPVERIKKQIENTLDKYNSFVKNHNDFLRNFDAIEIMDEVMNKYNDYNLERWKKEASGVEEDKLKGDTVENLREVCDNIRTSSELFFNRASELWNDSNAKCSDAHNKNLGEKGEAERVENYVKAVDTMVEDLIKMLMNLRTVQQKEGKAGNGAKDLIIGAVRNYNGFLNGYNAIYDKYGETKMGELVKNVLGNLGEGSSWVVNGRKSKYKLDLDALQSSKSYKESWNGLIAALNGYLPEKNRKVYESAAQKIGEKIDKINGEPEKLKLMEKYNKMCDKMLNYTNSVLKRLEKEAKYEDPIEDDEEKSKGFFDKVKGKASKLVRKGKKVVAHKLDNSEKELDNSEKELDAAQKESKVEYEGTGRSVKQSVVDQPEYKTFKAVGQIIARKPVDFSSVLDKLKEGPSSAKSLRSKLKVMITDNNISKWKLENDKEFEAKVGVLYIGIAYLPSGSKGIEAACKGLSVGGIKGDNGMIGNAHKLMRAMKKGTRKGLEGHNLVKDPDVKEGLKYFVNEDKIPKIESQFSTLLKLKRKAAKLGSKAKETAKKAATKIGKSSVGKAAKSAATTAGGGIKSAARSVKKGILKRIKGSKSKKDSVKQETGVIDLEKPNTGEKSIFWGKKGK